MAGTYGSGDYGGSGGTPTPTPTPGGGSACTPGMPRADLLLTLDGSLDGRQAWGPMSADSSGPQRYVPRPPPGVVGPAGFLQVSGKEFLIDGLPVKVAGTVSHGGGTHGAYNTGSTEIDDFYPRALDFQEMARLKLKFCRLMFSYVDPTTYTTKFFDWLDEAVDAAELYGVKLLPCCSTLPQDPANPQIRNGVPSIYPDASELYTRTYPSFWTVGDDAGLRQDFLDMWLDVVTRYVGRAGIGAWDILNEPTPDTERGGVVYWDWAQDVYDAIRAEDPDHVILFEAAGNLATPVGIYPRFPYATYPGVPADSVPARNTGQWPLQGTNIAYSFHSYVPFNYTHHKPPINGTSQPTGSWPGYYTHPGTSQRYYDRAGLQNWYDVNRADQVAFAREYATVVGEFGSASNPGQDQYVRDATDWFNDEGWGWLYFRWRSYKPGEPEYVSSGGVDQEFGIYSGYVAGTEDDPNFSLPNIPLQQALGSGATALEPPPMPDVPQIVVEEATTNTITNPRPASTTGWAANAAGNTIAYATDLDGGYLNVVVDGSTTSQGVKTSPNNLYPAAQGQTWTFSVDIEGTGGESDALVIQIIERSGATGGTFGSSSTSAVIRPLSRQRYVFTRTLTDAATTFVAVAVRRTGTPRSSSFKVRRMQLEQKAYSTSYTDGDSGPGYVWTGTVGASSSTRTATTVTADGAHRVNVRRGSMYVRVRFDSLPASGRYVVAVGVPGTGTFIGLRTGTSGALVGVFQEGEFDPALVSIGTIEAGQEYFVYLGWDGATVYASLDGSTPTAWVRNTPPSTALAGTVAVGSLPNGTLWANARVGPLRFSRLLSNGEVRCWDSFVTQWLFKPLSAGTEIVLDPAEVAGTRVGMELNWGAIRVAPEGPDWGDSQFDGYMADAALGSYPVDGRIPNRLITIPLLLGADPREDLDEAVTQIQAKVGQFQREGGWLRRGADKFADIVNATLRLPDKDRWRGLEENAVLTLEALPVFYRDWKTLGLHTKTTTGFDGGELRFVEQNVEGDLPGEMRLIATDLDNVAQAGLIYSLRSRHYADVDTARPSYAARDMTPLDASTIVAIPGYGGVEVVSNSRVGPSWTPMLSTDLAAVGSLTHTGSYCVFVKIHTTGADANDTYLRFVWDVGDFSNPTPNPAVLLPKSGGWHVIKLGEIRLDRVPVGTHRWRGQVQGLHPASNKSVSLQRVHFHNIDEAFGILRASIGRSSSFGTFVARDEFDLQSPGPVTGTSLLSGGSWVGAGDTDDFLVVKNLPPYETTGYLARNVGNDNATAFNNGRFILAGTSSYTDIAVQTHIRREDFEAPGNDSIQAAVARYTDTSNCLFAGLVTFGSPKQFLIRTFLYAGGVMNLLESISLEGIDPTEVLTIKLTADSGGRWATYVAPFGLIGQAEPFMQGQDDRLATGGTHATGRIGLYDTGYTQTDPGRYWDGFQAWVPDFDAVLFPGRSLELRTDGAYREAIDGESWGPVSRIEGDLPRIPVAGLEGRPVEFFVKFSRGDFDGAPDNSFTDDQQVQVQYRPAFLMPKDD